MQPQSITKLFARIFPRSHPISPRLHRQSAVPDLHLEFLCGELDGDSNPDVYTNDGGYHIGTEDEVFTPAERAVRKAQRQSQLIEQRRQSLLLAASPLHYQNYDEVCKEKEEAQATGGAQNHSGSGSRITICCPDPSPSPSLLRSSRLPPRPAPINIALANTLCSLTNDSRTVGYVTDTHNSEYMLHGYGQQHLQASWSDLQIMSRAANMARQKRRCGRD